MTPKQTLIAGLALALAVSIAGEALARSGKGCGAMDGQGRQSRSQAGASATPTRPEGSRRRDGTFQSTGTTATGATMRPGNGRGLAGRKLPRRPRTSRREPPAGLSLGR